MLTANSIFKNFSLGVSATLLSKILRFIYVTIIIKKAGADVWGEVAYAIAIISYVHLFLEYGKSTTSSFYKVSNGTWDTIYYNSMVWNRFVIACIFSLFIWVLGYSWEFAGAGALRIYLLFALIKPFFLDWLFIRKNNNGNLQLFQLIRQSGLFVFVLLLSEFNSTLLVTAEIISELFIVFFSWIFSKDLRKSIKLFPSLSTKQWRLEKKLFLQSYPWFISIFFLTLHQNGDILVLRWVSDTFSVGVYDFSYKIMLFIFSVGSSLTFAIRPRLAMLSKKNFKDASQLLVLAQALLLPLSFLAMVFVFFGAEFILNIILKRPVQQEIELLKWLIWYVVFGFYNIPIAEWIVINKPAKFYLIMTILAGCSNIILNIVFIPMYGIIGAAMATIAIEGAYFIFDSIVQYRIQPNVATQFYKVLGLVSLACIPISFLYNSQSLWFFAFLGCSIILFFTNPIFRKAPWHLLFKKEVSTQ